MKLKFILLLIMNVAIIIFIRNISRINITTFSKYNNKSVLYKFYSECLSISSNFSNIHNQFRDYKNGVNLWSEVYKGNKESLCMFLLKTNLFEYRNSYYYHRLYSYERKNILVEGDFPDKSYYRLQPEIKADKTNVITHTYDVQKYIYNYQHPMNCEDKKFLVIKAYSGGGHGCEIHFFTSYLALAISVGRIAILDPYFHNAKADGDYCAKEKNWL